MKEESIILATLNEVMEIAEKRKIAIGSFNTPNLESLLAVIQAAEELDLPVIIQFAQCHEPWIPLAVIGPVMMEAARKSAVPVCVHLDHGETLEYLQQALDLGFTGIDELACSFGTTHGIYLTEPKLDFDVVRNVRRLANGIPVVMHGGSGVSREDYRKAVEAGVRKINYFTYMDKAGGQAAAEYARAAGKEPVFFSSVSMASREAMKENVKQAMKMFALMD